MEEKLNNAGKVVIFGAGSAGIHLKGYLATNMQLQVDYFIDNDPVKWGTTVDNIPVIPPSDIFLVCNTIVDPLICIASNWAGDIARQLEGMGIKNYLDLTYWDDRWKNCFDYEKLKGHLEDLEKVYLLLEDEGSRETLVSLLKYRLSLNPLELRIAEFGQYFHPEVSPNPGEIIFDCGAWQGDTAIKFATYLNKNCKIVCFEPERVNYNLLLENVQKEGLHETVLPVRAGVWNVNTLLTIQEGREGGSMSYYICEEEGEVPVVKLDDFVVKNGLLPDLIKMDIEGAEYRALLGSREIIQRYRPRMQICVYHRCEDLWEIPLFLRDLQPSYRFYLGHHTQNFHDTVLYAVAG